MEQKINFDNDNLLVLTQLQNSYQSVLDDFKNAKNIRICTYNISSNKDVLLDLLKSLSDEVNIKIITNIPGRFENYFGDTYRVKASKIIKIYLEKLSPKKFKSSFEIYFNFTNHAKIITTDNYGYIGSGNFSDESQNNIECGVLISNKKLIGQIDEQFFDTLIPQSYRYLDGKTSELLIELKYYLASLSEIKRAVFDGNNTAINDILSDRFSKAKISIDNRFIIELMILMIDIQDTLQTSKFNSELVEVFEILKSQGEIINNCCTYNSELYNYTSFNIDHETQAKFEEMGHLDDGENTDKILLDAQEMAMDNYTELRESIIDPISELSYSFPLYLAAFEKAIKIIEKLDEAEKTIDNTYD